MLRRLNQNWHSCKNSVFSCKVLRTYIATHYLFVKIIFPFVPCIQYTLMELNFAIWFVQYFRWAHGCTTSWEKPTAYYVKMEWLFCLQKNQKLYTTCSLDVAVDVSDLSAFMNECWGTIVEWSKVIYNQILHETLRQNGLYYNNVVVGNWNSN